MAQTANADAQDLEKEGEEGAAPPSGKKWSGKKLVMIIVPAVLFIGGGAAVFFTGMLSAPKPAEETKEAVAEPAPPPTVFYQLPEMLVNLNSPGRRVNFLKIKISLELGKQEDVARVEAVMPRIIDNFQVYLREMRIEDLQGSAGLVRLREELLTRVRAAADPAVVNDVLFTEMLVQ